MLVRLKEEDEEYNQIWGRNGREKEALRVAGKRVRGWMQEMNDTMKIKDKLTKHKSVKQLRSTKKEL